MKWKDLRLIAVGMVCFYGTGGCGAPPADEQGTLPPSSTREESPPQEQKKPFQEKKSFARGESVDISEADIEAITVLSRLGIHCGLKRGHEYSCQLNIQDDEDGQGVLELNQERLSFKQAGDFLIKVIWRDRSEKIFWLRVYDPRQSALQKSPVDFRLVNQHDSFYPMISHFELRTLLPTLDEAAMGRVEVQWSIQGGRYHILDEELPVLSVLRPFHKSILFREHERYEVSASVFMDGQKKFEKKTVVDFGHPRRRSEIARVDLALERPAAAVGQWVGIKGEAETIARDLRYVWDVRKMYQTHCSEDALAYEETERLNVSMARLKVCESDYEEEMYPDQDYLLDQRHLDQTAIRFKNPGQYRVILRVFNREGDELLGQSARRLTIGAKRISTR